MLCLPLLIDQTLLFFFYAKILLVYLVCLFVCLFVCLLSQLNELSSESEEEVEAEGSDEESAEEYESETEMFSLTDEVFDSLNITPRKSGTPVITAS